MSMLPAAAALGFLGSFHCIGMCGPIALALPVHHRGPYMRYGLIALYNVGRIITYALFGIACGAVGKGFAMAGLQQALSVAIGVMLLISVLLPVSRKWAGHGAFLHVKQALGKLFASHRRSSLFFIGVLNGFLPCGLVYAAMAGSVASDGVIAAMSFMAAFGAGTAPMMFALPLIGSKISMTARNRIRKITPVAIGIMALLLVLRGLNLGLPYVSPRADGQHGAQCHMETPAKPPGIQCRVPRQVQSNNTKSTDLPR